MNLGEDREGAGKGSAPSSGTLGGGGPRQRACRPAAMCFIHGLSSAWCDAVLTDWADGIAERALGRAKGPLGVTCSPPPPRATGRRVSGSQRAPKRGRVRGDGARGDGKSPPRGALGVPPTRDRTQTPARWAPFRGPGVHASAAGVAGVWGSSASAVELGPAAPRPLTSGCPAASPWLTAAGRSSVYMRLGPMGSVFDPTREAAVCAVPKPPGKGT